MWHCRTLLATGSSARSVREQLFLNGAFFLRHDKYLEFRELTPALRWFQSQREGLGNESMTYSFISIAMCDEICQWGFDETHLNGVPTLNQWCRIKEGECYRTITIECGCACQNSLGAWTTGRGNGARGIGGGCGYLGAFGERWSNDGKVARGYA